MGFIITTSSFCHFASLLAFYYTSNKATKYKQQEKKKVDHDFEKAGQRDAIQVLCNGLCPTVFSLLYLIFDGYGEKEFDFINNYVASMCSIAVLGKSFTVNDSNQILF